MADDKGVWKNYVCQFCGYEFNKIVYYNNGGGFSAGKSFLRKKKQAYSSIVKCPKCQNLIPTWRKEKIEDTHGVGKQHFHPDRR